MTDLSDFFLVFRGSCWWFTSFMLFFWLSVISIVFISYFFYGLVCFDVTR